MLATAVQVCPPVSGTGQEEISDAALEQLTTVEPGLVEYVMVQAKNDVKALIDAASVNSPECLSLALSSAVCLLEIRKAGCSPALKLAVEVVFEKLGEKDELADILAAAKHIADQCNQLHGLEKTH